MTFVIKQRTTHSSSHMVVKTEGDGGDLRRAALILHVLKGAVSEV